MLINDTEGHLVPILELFVGGKSIKMKKDSESLNVGGTIILKCSYFNSLPSKWEPIIEEFGLDFEFAMQKNPKLALTLGTNKAYETLNLNISQEMVNIIPSYSDYYQFFWS